MATDTEKVAVEYQAEDPGNLPAIPKEQQYRFCYGRSEHMPIAARLSDYTPRELEWLWPGRIPLGALTLLVGDPGMGKSFLTMEIAACVTSGRPLIQLENEPQEVVRPEPASVILLSTEDSVSDTIYPRFKAAGGDPKRLTLLRAVGAYDKDDVHLQWQFSLAKDLAALEELLDSHLDCRLVVIDPISAHLGGGSTNNTEMRKTLAPLVSLAARRRVAVLAVTHLNKANQGPLVYRAIGSIALAAAARSVLVVLPHPHEPRWRIVAPMKSNLARPAGALRYRIGTHKATNRLRVLWKTQPMAESTESLIAEASKGSSNGPAALEAVNWLHTVLLDGPLHAIEVKKMAKLDGIHERTLLRAKARMRLITERVAVDGKFRWMWSLPVEARMGGEYEDEAMKNDERATEAADR